MDNKKIRKALSHFAGRAGLGFCSLIVKFTPQRCLYGLAEGLASIGYTFAKRQRNIALDSLSKAFGKDLPRQKLEAIARDCFRDMAKSALELLFLMDRPGLLKRSVSFKGLDNLKAALLRGKGAVLVSAHFGNFPLLMAKLALEDYDISGIMRPMRDSRVEKLFMEKRQRLKVKTIYSQPRDTCVNATIQSLRANGLVFIPLDQNFGTAGVFVDFFGQKAATATGPVIFAQRTDAALIPCFIVRKPDNTHEIIFEPQLELEEVKEGQNAVRINVQRITDVIERYIRKYPHQWGWIHRRWKSRPKEES